ncbi:hypothetical protein GCM10023188_39200 [Pontibacter saemangeumensis]|uniref:Uncharacterized protein n=1 Tax=Pontibacter saemangeumensis TaxID=1084525 RepID=A0ABP8M198_9BACT
MGHKAVCLNCRKAFSLGSTSLKEQTCTECGNALVYFNHKFRPPRRANLKAWKVVSFLYDHGFTYQHLYKDISHSTKVDRNSSSNYIEYPVSMEEAKEFVEKNSNQARKLKE